MNSVSEIMRWIFALFGAIVAILEPALPYIGICTLAILYDCYTAWSLGKRVRKAYPDRTSAEAKKFKSQHFGKVVQTLIKAWAMIVLAFFIQLHIIGDSMPVDLTKVAAGAICFWQLWSILENESSCNGAKWAQVLQKILVDKTERHFNVDLDELKDHE